ncbi:MAG: TetM/TetW/TetO/TetS family tetracycline resistance ribosomal protection protein [Lachnospiraceae bacterium]|nr:TetM/TetW/TetO/TetS family tetracycline resistance ribosomal protection protein [Lachnospiraceae bacterium]
MNEIDKKKFVVGILAHVDSGKTTLAESMLYVSGSIRKAGRVDHGDTFLDTDIQERTRGITIFSKQAEFSWREMDVTLLDTPGHVDFSAEMERTLQVLDYAVLVVSGADGVQAHVATLWKLLKRYHVPVFLFVNKMDQPQADQQSLMRELQEKLDGRCVDFSLRGAGVGDDVDKIEKEALPTGIEGELAENIAVCDEGLLEKYIENAYIGREDVVAAIADRKLFPCYFGSALKIEGIEELLDGILYYTRPVTYPDAFGARVYKIGRDSAGNRLTYMKITGGKLCTKQLVADRDRQWEEKADQIRIYSGEKYRTEQEVPAGAVCVVTGLSRTFSGEGLGIEQGDNVPLIFPVMSYRLQLPVGEDVHVMYKKLCQLEEEEPLLHMVWKEQVGEIHVQLMGEVQIEILQHLIESRFGVKVEFDTGSIVYKETISDMAEGVGHFEPLRHYAEVHLLMEPGEAGSGLVFGTACSEDDLDRNWQRLVLTHLEEKEHIGILTGSPLTDMKITLVAGKAHNKHTEGGDFRQATYRALRHGLHRARCVLLEPVYAFRIELPATLVGRAMSDIQERCGHFDAPLTNGEECVLTGTVPVAGMQDYHTKLLAYSGGKGRFFATLKGYEPCHNPEEVIEKIGYDAERDLENPASSVFCSHGAGTIVEWQDVEAHMHLESVLGKRQAALTMMDNGMSHAGLPSGTSNGRQPPIYREGKPGQGNDGGVRTRRNADAVDEKELEEIFNRTYGSSKKNTPARSAGNRRDTERPQDYRMKETDTVKEYLLVDGYNIIFAWEELSELAKMNLDSARGRLMDILSNYQGYRKMTLILVFDAYKVKGNPGSVSAYHNIHVVYTKEAETADQYIEKATHEIAKKHHVTVATSDGLEQLIIMGQGASRMSARELKENIMSTNEELRELFLHQKVKDKQYLFDALPDDLAKRLEAVRLGEQEF